MPLKVLHLPTSTGGNAWGLSHGERKIGIKSDVLVCEDNWLKYPCDINLHLEKCNNRLEKFIKLLEAFFKIYKKYDVYHFNFGKSLLDFPGFGLDLMDIPFYRGRKIFVTYNGCDARQKYITIKKYNYSACHRDECYGGVCCNPNIEVRKRKRIERFGKYANGFFAVNPDLLSFLPPNKAFLPYTVGEEIKYIGISARKRVHIVHAPTNRVCKGSDYVLPVLDEIKARYGDLIKVSIVENLPNKEALKIYADADLIIDQLLIGWYGGFAVEAMRMGKPVMCFIREEDLQFIPKKMAQECCEAIINANAETIYEKLCELIEDRNLLRRHSLIGREYVENWHDSVKVAMKVREHYQA